MTKDFNLENVTSELRKTRRKQLHQWAVRWVIGFGIIALAVHYFPNFSWLWWLGFIIALLSLLFILLFDFILRRRLSQGQARISEFERLAEEAENQARHQDDET